MGRAHSGCRCGLAVRCLQGVADQARHQDQPRHPSDASRGDALCALSRESRLPGRGRRGGGRWPPPIAERSKEDAMFAVIFEVQPKPERWDDYLGLAKQLKPKLEAIDGFIDNERFESKRTKGRLLSLSTWRDEKAVIRWRSHG